MFTIDHARPEEQAQVFQLVFQHLPALDQQVRQANARQLLEAGDLDPRGLLVARTPEGLGGALVGVLLPGSSGLVWPPGVRAGPLQSAMEDALVQAARAWLRRRGAKLCQAMVAPAEFPQAACLLRNGFVHMTRLQYLRHDLENVPFPSAIGLTLQSYGPDLHDLFLRTLLRTYQGTQDCPELNGLRSGEEILIGHQAQGLFDPSRWWLAWEEDRPVGVLLLTQMFGEAGWDLSYVGVVLEARRRGHGRHLTQLALATARGHHAPQLTLAVDVRNHPARMLYESLGFQAAEPREVLLAFYAPDQYSPDEIPGT